MSIHIKNVQKRFGEFVALDDVTLSVANGELVALLGPSGSGKTTLLRIIAGLEFADGGEVRLDGEEAGSRSVRARNVGFVFQHYALFKHMTVFENVAFGLRVMDRKKRPPEIDIRRKSLELLKMVHLEGLHKRYPSQLSGGQRQRVALARALAVRPKILLLDEPFGALDAKVRKDLRRFLRSLHDEIGVTTVFVTHDQEEAMEVADRVVVMSQGRIEQAGSPAEVWNKPKNAFVYDFLGNYNVFSGEADASGAPKKLFARPHETLVAKNADGDGWTQVKLLHVNPAGPLIKLEMEGEGGASFRAEIPPEIMEELNPQKNDALFVKPKRTARF